MKEELSRRFHENLEENHWWFAARRKIILDQLKRIINEEEKKPNILDIGCATGVLVKYLNEYGSVKGIDASMEAVDFCKERGLDNVSYGDARALPFKNNEFDLIVMLDVLEHVDNDKKVLEEIERVLRPGGFAIITVPAYKFLWSKHDEELGHLRRYVKGKLSSDLKNSKFKIIKISYFNFFLFPLVAGVRLIKKLFRRTSGSDLAMYPKTINNILKNIFSSESLLLKFINFPMGSSILAIVKKS